MKYDSMTTRVYKATCTALPLVLLASSLLSLTACTSALDRIEAVGSPPPMQAIIDPTVDPNYKPVSWPMPVPEAAPKRYANSLWQQGSRTFFRDQRASRVGDILRVMIELKDKGKLENTTDRTRASSEEVGLGAMFGLSKIVPGQGGANGLLQMNGDSTTSGDGQIERKEEIETQVAATVVQVLPNGNLVIDGRQEIRINNEIREISVQGVVRPEDIGSSNTIEYSQIAEARISYGGRGQISDIQGPRWGHGVIEAVSPF
ncbi:MAG: flagellar basal body L-ring protein FlgH [Rickettsiales bacterium]